MHEAKRVFVDTNVLLHFIDYSEPIRQVCASEGLQHRWVSGTGSVSWQQVLHESYFNATRELAGPPTEARFLADTFPTWHPVAFEPAG